MDAPLTLSRAPLPIAGHKLAAAQIVFRPVLWFAALGILLLLFQIYVLGRWATGPNFVATPPGPDRLSESQRVFFLGLQIFSPLIAAGMIWHWVIAPWRRGGRITTDGCLMTSFALIFFWDMVMNFSSTVLFYNSHLFNRGSWSLGSWPGWLSPKANLLPEPLLTTPPGYLIFVFSQVMIICWLLDRVKSRWPGLGFLGSLIFIVVGLTILDTLVEGTLLRTGLYAYPGGIRSVTLFAGQTYQIPLTESLTFGGLGCGATALLSHYRRPDGRTWAEAGLDEVHFVQDGGRQWLRFLAIFGFVHGAFVLLYALPNQFISLESDPFPAHYPSYLQNGMCVYGPHADQCPGPGVMMPRPPFAGDGHDRQPRGK